MELAEAREILNSSDIKIKEEKRLPNNMGTQLQLENGAIVNIYDTGTLQVQGKPGIKKIVEKIFEQTSVISNMNIIDKKYIIKKDVFVVYGHDTTSRSQLEAMLRRWKLNPLFLDQLPTEGQTVIEKMESAIDQASFGIVLATPDDEGNAINAPKQKQYRVRQNVVLELGMLLANLGRENVAILLKDQKI